MSYPQVPACAVTEKALHVEIVNINIIKLLHKKVIYYTNVGTPY